MSNVIEFRPSNNNNISEYDKLQFALTELREISKDIMKITVKEIHNKYPKAASKIYDGLIQVLEGHADITTQLIKDINKLSK